MLWFRISGLLGEHGLERRGVAAEVRDQDLDGALGQPSPDRADRRREVRRAAVGQVVAVDRRDDGVRKAELLGGLGDALRARPGRAHPGWPLPTAQKPQWRVQMSPISMNVAVRSLAQHSWMFGQRASSQTVVSDSRRIISRTASYSPGRVGAHLEPLGPLEAQGAFGGQRGQLGAQAAIISRPKTSAKLGRDGRATSATSGARWSRRSIVVTPPSVMPQGTMPEKFGSGASVTFRAKPCVVTQREMWMPIAAILSLPTQSDETRSLRSERAARDSEVRERPDQDVLEIRDVAFDVAAVGMKVDDRVADELSRAVVRDLASPVGLEDVDAELPAPLRREENVGRAALRPSVNTGSCSSRKSVSSPPPATRRAAASLERQVSS